MRSELNRDRALDLQYREKMTAWLATSKQLGKTPDELARLTKYFQFDSDENSKERSSLDKTTLSRIVRFRPVKTNKSYSLLRVLGVFHLLNLVTNDQIKEFIEEHDIPISTATSWEFLFEKINTGIQLYNEYITSPDQLDKSSNNPITPQIKYWGISRSRILPIAVLTVILGMIVFFFGAKQLTLYLNPNTTCQETIAETPPIFLPDQGFSQFQMLSDNSKSSILSNNIRSIGLNSDSLWVGYLPVTDNVDRVSQYKRLDDKPFWIHHCLNKELSAGQNVNDFAFKNGSIFFATDGAGVVRFEGVNWRFYTQFDGLPSDIIYSLFVDDTGELWAATYEGVARLNGERWQTIYQGKPGELASSHVFSFLEDPAGNQWFGLLNQGISRLDTDGQWYSYFTDDPNLQNIRGATTDNEGGVWFATDRSGVIHFSHDGNRQIYNVADGNIPSDVVQDVEKDILGRIWVATERGLVYTSDLGETWLTHSTMNTLNIEFGCKDCLYNENHLWLVLKGQGLGHVRIPPLTSTVKYLSIPSRVKLKPGENYTFEVKVEAVSEPLTSADGDSLRSTEPKDTYLYEAYPIIPVNGEVQPGESYTFTNVDNPIIAPDQPGIYQLNWRIWQGRRFVTEPITVEFEVVTDE